VEKEGPTTGEEKQPKREREEKETEGSPVEHETGDRFMNILSREFRGGEKKDGAELSYSIGNEEKKKGERSTIAS